jgi:hypothetical protein
MVDKVDISEAVDPVHPKRLLVCDDLLIWLGSAVLR